MTNSFRQKKRKNCLDNCGKMKDKANLANTLTASRMLLAIVLLFMPVFSALFYAIYIICGMTDIADGFIARKTNTASDFGAKFDSIADLVFVSICLIKILPVAELRIWIWVLVTMVALIKVINIVSGYVYQKKLVLMHTTANKLTGLLLFVLPLTIKTVDINLTAIPVCAVATFAVVQEGHFIRTGV